MTDDALEAILAAEGWPFERIDATTWRSGSRPAPGQVLPAADRRLALPHYRPVRRAARRPGRRVRTDAAAPRAQQKDHPGQVRRGAARHRADGRTADAGTHPEPGQGRARRALALRITALSGGHRVHLACPLNRPSLTLNAP